MLASQVLETINPGDIHVFDKVTNWRRLLQRWTGNKREKLTFRERTFRFFDDPLSSPEALVFGAFMVGLIFMSVVTLFLSSLPRNWLKQPPYIDVLEIIATAFFTLEFVVRLCTAPVWWRWLLLPLTICDLFSTIPLYLDRIFRATVGQKGFVRVLRILRIFRILKLGRFSESFRVLSRTLVAQYGGIILLIALYVLGFIIWGTLVFFAEMTVATFDEASETWILPSGTVAPFQSIPEVFWFSVVSMSTTGYGDFVPASKLGKVVAAFSVTYGLVMLSFPIALLGSQFTEEWKAFKFEQLEEAERKGLETGGLKRRLEHTPAQIAHILRGHISRIDAILAEAQVQVEEMKRWKEDLTDLWCKSKLCEDVSVRKVTAPKETECADQCDEDPSSSVWTS